MYKRTLLFVVLTTSLLLSNGCTTVVGALAGWDGARMAIRTPANLGTKSLFGIAWCIAPDRVCQKSLPGTELTPGVGGGGYSLFPDNKIRVPERMEVSWYDADGEKHQQVVELDIPGREEVIRRYGAPLSTWHRRWDIVLIFQADGTLGYAWRLSDTTDRTGKFQLPKALVYWGNRDVFVFEPGAAETVMRYEPER
ncbi:MAG: hypothetical protein KZQ76_04780 [Candidatus Thiodiazotropha sp. (ex Epidulcina cf. delphinae)]|nr:hypothetical protein [Candidatus Thiodiazotropha sp. (ex Epidulcina cf. delphinae)]